MIKGILIDMGDTLINNLDINFKNGINSIYDLFHDYKISKNEFVYKSNELLNEIFQNRTIIEFRMIDYIKMLMDYFGLNSTYSIYEIEEVLCNNSSIYKIVDGAEEFLKYLKNKNYPIIVLSNTSFSKPLIKKMLGDLNDYIDEIIVSSDYPLRKPHYSFFDIGIKKLNMDKSNIYYIGNSFYYDVVGSYEAGINSIWFNKIKDKPLNNIAKYREITAYKQLIDEGF